MGWGDAWAGLSQQAFGATVDILQQKEQRKYQTERDEMARRAAEQQEEARRKWEEKTLRLRASLDKEARREEQSFRSKESDKGRKFEAQQAAEQRGLTRSYYDQMNRNEQARLGLQREEMAQRQGLAQMRASGEGAKLAASDSILNNIRTEFRDKGPEEAYRLAVQKYGQEIADAAFGGVAPAAQDRRNTWQGIGQSLMGGLRSISGQNDDINSILNKYSSN